MHGDDLEVGKARAMKGKIKEAHASGKNNNFFYTGALSANQEKANRDY